MLGTRLGDRYEIVSELGRGGMGVVYKARDPLLNRDVAVKLIPPTLLTPQSEERFQREAQLVAQMNHPGIVSIFDIGRHEGAMYFLMPVVQGTNLRNFLREKPRSLGQVLDIIIQVAEALEYSHARGVIHRDIKPENIMVTEEVGTVRVWVMDFGLAKGAGDQRLTKTGTMVGTVSYFSPEQVLAKEIDHRSDIYALGTVLYEALAGEPPFVGEMQSVVYRVVHEIPRALKEIGVDVSDQLQTIIERSLAKDPSRRYQSAADMANDLRRFNTNLQASERERSVILSTMMTAQWNRPASAPFIGREKEFAELQRKLNAAIDGDAQFVTVAGEPGIGKTRLLEELENLAKAKKVRVLHGRFAEQSQASAYQGFRDVIHEYFRAAESGSSSGERADFSDLANDLVSVFPLLSEISEIRAASGESATTESRKADDRTWVFELIARTISRIGGGRPLLILFENLHGAEMSLEALAYLVQRLGSTPTMICGTYRQSEVDRRHPLVKMLDGFRDDPHFASITLGPLSPSEHRQLVESVVGSQKLSPSLARRLYDATEANPFFTRELIRSLVDGGAISRDDTGEWSLSGEAAISSDALPETIQQTVEKRIERLPEDLREVLSIASVIGKSFEFDDLEALAEDKGDIGKIIDRLVAEGLIEEERESRGDRLTFSSGIVRDVLYNALSRRGRRSLHRKYAELIEKRHKGRLERMLPQLVVHFSEGDIPEKTVEYGLQLAKKSLASYSAEEAIHVLKTMLDFLKEDDWTGDRAVPGETRMLLATAYKIQGNLEAALREADVALRVFEREKLQDSALEAMLFAAENSWQARRVEEAQRWTARGLDASRAANATEPLGRFLSLAATLAHLRGEYDLANSYLEEIERIAPAHAPEADKSVPRGGRVRVALNNPIVATEPALIETDEEVEVFSLVFEPPMTFDERGHLVPSLCENWDASDDGKSFFFDLRKDVRFQDGTPLLAEDLKRSFEHSIRRRRREMKPAFAQIEGVQEFFRGEADHVAGLIVHSPQRLEVRTEEAPPIYPAFLTEVATAALREITNPDGTKSIVGTGPFVVKEHTRERIVLSANRQYWRGTPPAADEIEFRMFGDPSGIAAELRSGAIDIGRDLSPHDLEELLRDQRFRGGLVEAPKQNTYFIIFNAVAPERPGVQEARLNAAARRAILGVLRVRDTVWQTLGRLAHPAASLLPPGILGHDPGRKRMTLTRDEAQSALAAAGFALPIKLRAAAHPILLNRFRSFTDALLQAWREIGVEVEIETTSMESYLQRFSENSTVDLIIGRWNADFDDPDNFTHGLFDSTAGAYSAWFHSPETDALMNEARSASQPSARESLYRKLESRLLDEGNLLPLFHDIDYRIASSKVKGLQLRGRAPYVNYSELGKVEEESAGPVTLRLSGGVLHVPMAEDVGSIDPATVTTAEEGEVSSTVFETLTRNDGVRVVPWLAQSITPEDGGRRYRVVLRDDVRFHDGRRLTARDVRYSWERVLTEGTSLAQALFLSIVGAKEVQEKRAHDLAGFRIISNREFTIDLITPIAFFPTIVSFPSAAIIHEGSTRLTGSWREGCVGTGPFRVVQFQPHRELELERNPNYWRPGYPKSDGLVFHLGASPEQIKSEFMAGRYSLAYALFPADVEALRQDPLYASGYRETPRLSTYFIALNRLRGPLSDPSLRRRLTQSIDVPSIVRRTLRRGAIPAHGVIPPGLLGHRVASGSPAAQPASGEPEIELTASLHPTYTGQFSAVTDELLAAMKKAGFRVKFVTANMDQYIEAEESGSTDISLTRWIADYPDTDSFAVGLFHSQSGSVGKICGGADIDRLADAGRVELDPQSRHLLYRQMEDLLSRESVVLPLFHEQIYWFGRPEVEGLTLNFSVPEVSYENLRIVR